MYVNNWCKLLSFATKALSIFLWLWHTWLNYFYFHYEGRSWNFRSRTKEKRSKTSGGKVVLKFVGNSNTDMMSTHRWLSTIEVGELCIYDMPLPLPASLLGLINEFIKLALVAWIRSILLLTWKDRLQN